MYKSSKMIIALTALVFFGFFGVSNLEAQLPSSVERFEEVNRNTVTDGENDNSRNTVTDGENDNQRNTVTDGENTNQRNTVTDGVNVNNAPAQELKEIKLTNPLSGGGIDSFPALIESLVGIVLTIGVPVIALAIIYTGFLFVTAQGNAEKITKAKNTFRYVIIGSAILLAAYVLAEAIDGTIRAIRGGN